MTRAVLALALAAGVWLASPQRASAQGLFSCTISVTGVNFGPYDVFGASPVDSTGNVRYRCGILAFNITITLSRGQSPTFSPRTMVSGSEQLGYNLYLDAAHTVIWGDGSGGTQQYSIVNPPNGNVNLPIYGRIPPGQDVRAGAYNDTIVATINF
jgi:spore coat protein U-like protein